MYNASWEARNFPHFMKPKCNYHTHNNLPLVPVLSQYTQSHTHYARFILIIFPFVWLDSPRGLFFSAFQLNFLCISHISHTCHKPLHFIYVDMIMITHWRIQCTNFDALLPTSISSLWLPFLLRTTHSSKKPLIKCPQSTLTQKHYSFQNVNNTWNV